MNRPSFDPPSRDLAQRIHGLAIPSARRTQALAEYEHAERSVARAFGSVAAMIGGASAAFRESFARRRAAPR